MAPTGYEAKEIVGYDCEIGQSAYSEVSLLNVKKCQNISAQYTKSGGNRVQVIQRVQFEDITIMSCNLQLTFEAAYCGLDVATYSLGWDSVQLAADETAYVSRTQCTKAFLTRELQFFDTGEYASRGKVIAIGLGEGLRSSGTLILRGSEEKSTSYCTGESFYFNQNLYNTHVLKMKYKARVRKVEGRLSHQMKTLRINDEITTSKLEEGAVFDTVQGNFYFNPIQLGNTTTNEYKEVARGTGEIHQPKNETTNQWIAIIRTDGRRAEQQLAILLKGKRTICIIDQCQEGFETHLKGVYILALKLGSSHFHLEEVGAEDVNELLNIKASYGTIFINQQLKLTATFNHLATLLCHQSREMMLADIAKYAIRGSGPQEGEQGKLMLKAGSVAYMLQCRQVLVELQTNITRCFENVPVIYKTGNNMKQQQMFLDPITYNLDPVGKEQQCAELAPNKYGLLNKEGILEWLCLTKRGWVDSPACSAPPELNPMHVGELYEMDMKQIDTELYSEHQINSVNRKLWEQKEQESIGRELANMLKDIQRGEAGDHRNLERAFTQVIQRAKERVQEAIFPDILLICLYIWDKLGVLMILTFIVNMCANMIAVVGRARKIYEETKSYNWKLICCITNGLFLTLLPVKKECQCTKTEFMDKVMEELRARERVSLMEKLNNMITN